VTAANAHHDADLPDLVSVFVTTGIRTSGGAGPGVVRVPRDEAARIVAARHGVAGERPPRGYEDGGADGRIIAAMMPRLAPPEKGT
jgi:hypothetical protein